MQCMAALRNDVWFLSGKPKTETERFKANRALVLFFRRVSRGHDWHGLGIADGEGVGVCGSDLGRVRVLGGVEGGDGCRGG